MTDERRVPHADAFAAAGGEWVTGDAEIARIPVQDDGSFGYRFIQRGEAVNLVQGVKVVRFTPRGSYPLSRSARVTIRALLRLADEPSDAEVVKFASRFGPLLNFAEWLASVRYLVSDVHDGQELLRPQFMHSRLGREFPFPLAAETAADSPPHAGSDALFFMKWCVDNGHEEAAAYVKASLRVWPWHWSDLSPDLLREPVALYLWASKQLASFRRELDRGRQYELTSASRTWLAARLDETRLVLAPETGRLMVGTTSLLAYLTVRAYLDSTGSLPEVRSCAFAPCGKDFFPEDPRQRYCGDRCRWRANKRAARAGLASPGPRRSS